MNMVMVIHLVLLCRRFYADLLGTKTAFAFHAMYAVVDVDLHRYCLYAYRMTMNLTPKNLTLNILLSSLQKNQQPTTDSEALKDQRWAIACSSITFAITFIVVGMQLHPMCSALFVGTKVEGVIIVILTAFWCATVAIVSDARNGLAVSSDGGAVTNGNLYYFSWAGFVCSVMLVVSYLRGVFGVDVAGEIRNRSARLSLWSALLAAQLVVMGASANIFDQDCSPQTASDTFCSRTKFGISVGAVGTAFALAIVGMKIATASVSFMCESVISVILTTLNAFGVAYLTSAKGPGSALGNLYYFSWISLVCSAMLIASCFETYKNGGQESHEPGTELREEGNNGIKPDDFAVESLDDDNNI